MPVLETLYNTNAPELLERAEYYQPRIETKFSRGKWYFVVTETHAYYDGPEKDVVLKVETLNPQPEEGFATIEEARKRYDEQVKRRVTDGYVHSFYVEFDQERLGPVYFYRRLGEHPIVPREITTP